MTPDGTIPDGRLLGLSLRLCIDDLIHRRVPVDRVAMIISEFSCPDFAHWEKNVMLPGIHTWWARDPSRARQLVEQLRSAGIIHQPLLDGDDLPEFAFGEHWTPYPF